MEIKKIPTEVYAEMTPNPATMKFMVDRLLVDGGEQVEYTNISQVGESSPLAKELFNFPFVRSLFFSSNYVTVTKDESLGWEMIVMQLREHIRDWLMENEVAVAFVPEGLEPTAVAENDSAGLKKSKVDYSAIPPSEHDDAIKILLDEFVRPAVEQDGGAIDFLAFNEGKVYVRLRGACSGCPSSMMTLKGGIEQLLKSKISEVEAVVAEEG
jgi:NFU1 iron-sulfur cluster scaffold homolog, mitochondrial